MGEPSDEGLDAEQLPEEPPVDGPPHRNEVGVPPPVLVDGQDAPGRDGGDDQAVRLRQGETQRLLARHVLARLEEGQGERDVMDGRSGHERQLDVVVLGQLVDRRVGPDAGEIGLGGLAPVEFSRSFGDPFEQLSPVRRSRTRPQPIDRFAERLSARRVIDQLHRLPRDGAERELRAAEEAIEEFRDAVPEQARTIVVDEDRDVHRRDGRPGPDHVARLAAFFDGEIGGGEIGDGRTARGEGRHVDASDAGLERRGSIVHAAGCDHRPNTREQERRA